MTPPTLIAPAETRFFRLAQIIGRAAVTEEKAAENRRNGKSPKRACDAIPPIFPVSRSSWWAGIASGKFPAGIKMGPQTTVWPASTIQELAAKLAGAKGQT
jgi:hypothetical protein